MEFGSNFIRIATPKKIEVSSFQDGMDDVFSYVLGVQLLGTQIPSHAPGKSSTSGRKVQCIPGLFAGGPWHGTVDVKLGQETFG